MHKKLEKAVCNSFFFTLIVHSFLALVQILTVLVKYVRKDTSIVFIVKFHISNYLSNLRPQIRDLLSNSRPHPKSGVAYKKKQASDAGVSRQRQYVKRCKKCWYWSFWHNTTPKRVKNGSHGPECQMKALKKQSTIHISYENKK